MLRGGADAANTSAASVGLGGHPEVCAQHEWRRDWPDHCPYGWAGPGDVTWPDYRKAKRLGAPVYAEFEAPDGVMALCVAWSYVPYFMALVAVLKLLVWRTLWPWPKYCARLHGRTEEERREERPYAYLRLRRHGTKELSYVLLLGVIVGCNELLFKRIVAAPRPEMSCLLSCGMPSSHAALATGTLVLGLLDFSGRCTPRKAAGLSVRELRTLPAEEGLPKVRTIWQNVKHCLYDSLGSLQLAPFDEPSMRDFVGYAFVWAVLMLPVPYSRIQLSDHTPLQAMVGSFIGVAVGVIWYIVLHETLRRSNHLLGSRWPQGSSWAFEHNFALPCYNALLRCNPHSINPRKGWALRFQRIPGGLEQGTPGESSYPWLVQSIDEMEWYRIETLRRRDEMKHMGTLTQLEDHYLMARHGRIAEVLSLLRLELCLAEEVLEPVQEASVIRRFAERLTAPEPVGLGLQERSTMAQTPACQLRAAWQWDEGRELLEQLCTWCERQAARGDLRRHASGFRR